MRSAAEWNIGITVPPACCLLGKAHWVVTLGFGPNVMHVMGIEWVDADQGLCWNFDAFEFEIPDSAPWNGWHRWHHPHGFLKRHFRQRKAFELLITKLLA